MANNSPSQDSSPFTVHVKGRPIQVVGELGFVGKFPKGPSGIAVNSEAWMAVSDFDGHCILIYHKKGKYLRELASHGENEGQFNNPSCIIFINDDDVLVADTENYRIQQLNVKTGNFVKNFGKEGTGNGQFLCLFDVCTN